MTDDNANDNNNNNDDSSNNSGEQNTSKNPPPAQPLAPTDPPKPPTPPGGEASAIEKAETVVKAMAEQNTRFEKNMKSFEKMQAEAIVAGRGIAGQPPKTQDDKDTDAARDLLKGTGYDEQLFPTDKK